MQLIFCAFQDYPDEMDIHEREERNQTDTQEEEKVKK